MPQVFLEKLQINNLGPIKEDEVIFQPFTYFIGRNNAGKSHYLKAIEWLLAIKAPSKDEIIKLQNDKSQPIQITGYFRGAGDFLNIITTETHKSKIEGAIQDGVLIVKRILAPDGESKIGILSGGDVYSVSGFPQSLLKVLPETISIIASADTIDELSSKEKSALSKIKKEVLAAFLLSLKGKAQEALVELDKYLHGPSAEVRSQDLARFEKYLKDELMGEFEDVKPSVKFDLPNEEVIAKEMKIILDDGYPSEVEQKGHGLQRATLLAMLRVLAKYGARYHDRPTPIFLIGELETFLHPYAQRLIAQAIHALIDRYQIVTSTHSPFIINPESIKGYRRVIKNIRDGTKNIAFPTDQFPDKRQIELHLEQRGNLEGLFADRVILVEGDHDQGFFKKIMKIFDVKYPPHIFTLFIKAHGKDQVRLTRKFYQLMGFASVQTVCDIDYIFSTDFVKLLKELGINDKYSKELRDFIGWKESKDPPLKVVIESLTSKGQPAFLPALFKELLKHKIYILPKGAPEMYYKNNIGQKDAWDLLSSEKDLLEPAYLKGLISTLMTP